MPAVTGLRESLDRMHQYVKDNELIVVIHPTDLTDEMRRMIEAAPLVSLHETKHVTPGQMFVVRPGLLDTFPTERSA